MLDRQIPEVSIERSKNLNEHGLCSAAETHWAIYLIQLINAHAVPPIHEGYTAKGDKIKFLRKAEDKRAQGFTFGADSYLVVSSEDPDLEQLILVEEETDVFVARPAISIAESLIINDYYEKEIQSRWKDCIRDFSIKKGISPEQINLTDLINECLALSK